MSLLLLLIISLITKIGIRVALYEINFFLKLEICKILKRSCPIRTYKFPKTMEITSWTIVLENCGIFHRDEAIAVANALISSSSFLQSIDSIETFERSFVDECNASEFHSDDTPEIWHQVLCFLLGRRNISRSSLMAFCNKFDTFRALKTYNLKEHIL